VPRLVGEQERRRLLEKRGRVVDPREPQHAYSSNSTRSAPLATRSPSATWTARTVAS
jgi:hypothetical protein